MHVPIASKFGFSKICSEKLIQLGLWYNLHVCTVSICATRTMSKARVKHVRENSDFMFGLILNLNSLGYGAVDIVLLILSKVFRLTFVLIIM